jgi:hypothetical protein
MTILLLGDFFSRICFEELVNSTPQYFHKENTTLMYSMPNSQRMIRAGMKERFNAQINDYVNEDYAKNVYDLIQMEIRRDCGIQSKKVGRDRIGFRWLFGNWTGSGEIAGWNFLNVYPELYDAIVHQHYVEIDAIAGEGFSHENWHIGADRPRFAKVADNEAGQDSFVVLQKIYEED